MLRQLRRNSADRWRTLAVLLAHEATADLATVDISSDDAAGSAPAKVLSDTIGVVPILRAGLGMAEGVMDLLPQAEVWHIGLFRDEATLRPTEYYNKFPPRPRVTLALLVDPMLATGGSARPRLRDHQAGGCAAA